MYDSYDFVVYAIALASHMRCPFGQCHVIICHCTT